MCLEKAIAKAKQYTDTATESISAVRHHSALDQAQMHKANIIRTRQSRRHLSDSEYDSDSNSDTCLSDGGEEETNKQKENKEIVMMVTSEETTEVTPEEDSNNYHTVLTKSGDGKLGKREVMEIGPNKTKGDIEMVAIQAKDGSLAKRLNTLRRNQGEEEKKEYWSRPKTKAATFVSEDVKGLLSLRNFKCIEIRQIRKHVEGLRIYLKCKAKEDNGQVLEEVVIPHPRPRTWCQK